MSITRAEEKAVNTASEPTQEQLLRTVTVTGGAVRVVDYEPTIRMLVVEILEELGYHALIAEDGASGLAILQSDTAIGLLVSDVGLTEDKWLTPRISRPDLKVLFITGYAESAVVGDGNLEIDTPIMTSPFTVDILTERI
ncbi:response regulator [Pseudomonas luteola]|uniref:response regulator n=1 Tax=Pseudomonas TaxID=286 RepID=UPI000F7974F0|nr:response regulator [Pseudomonas luteola]RRW42437.1 response regulator [Pseudomonas luteola]